MSIHIQTLETVKSKLNELYTEYAKLDIEFESFDQYTNDYIERIKTIFPETQIVENIKTPISIWRHFGFKIVLKYGNFIFWNIDTVKRNNKTEYKNKVSIFRSDYENVIKKYLSGKVFGAISFDNYNYEYETTPICNHGSLTEYIEQEHPITIKEILEINSLNFDDPDLIDLQQTIDSYIPNEVSIYFGNEQFKLYNSTDVLELNNLVLEYSQNKKSRSYTQMYLSESNSLKKSLDSEIEQESNFTVKKTRIN